MNKEVISEYYLERYALGELPDEEAEEIGRLASSDPELQAALGEIESSNREIIALYPPLIVKASLSTQLSEMPPKMPKRPFPLKPILAITSALTIVLSIILIPPLLKEKPGIVYPDPEPDVTLIKGIPMVDLTVTQLLVYRKIQDKVEILSDGDKAKAGDLLQLAYVATKESHGMIFSIDGRGMITLHFPESTWDSTKLEQNKQFSLPNAIELDDAPGFERFFFLTSGSPINVSAVLKGLEDKTNFPDQIKQTNLDLPESLNQYSILILKGAGS